MSTTRPAARSAALRRAVVVAAAAGLVALELLVARTYLGFGTWWHYLLHQLVGWGLGLATAALVATVSRWRAPAVLALVLVTVACLLAAPYPTTLAGFPLDTAPVEGA